MPHPRNLNVLSWIICVLALCAWVGVAFFITQVRSLRAEHSSKATLSQKQSVQAAQAASQHAAIVSAAPAIQQLATVSQVDPTHIAQAITAAGSAAGVAIDIKSATQGAVTAIDAKTTVQSYTFLVSVQGNFASVLYAAKLLATLPIPASLSQLQFTHLPTGQAGSKSSVWEMSAQLQIVSIVSSSS